MPKKSSRPPTCTWQALTLLAYIAVLHSYIHVAISRHHHEPSAEACKPHVDAAVAVQVQKAALAHRKAAASTERYKEEAKRDIAHEKEQLNAILAEKEGLIAQLTKARVAAEAKLKEATLRSSAVVTVAGPSSSGGDSGSGNIAKGLMHRAHPKGPDAIMGLCGYPKNILGMFRGFVGTLRHNGYDGHIILGVSPNLSEQEHAYLKKMDVTYYAAETG